jgi:hypothetical protein
MTSDKSAKEYPTVFWIFKNSTCGTIGHKGYGSDWSVFLELPLQLLVCDVEAETADKQRFEGVPLQRHIPRQLIMLAYKLQVRLRFYKVSRHSNPCLLVDTTHNSQLAIEETWQEVL